MTAEPVTTPPIAPAPDEDSAPYWAALRQHRLRVQECRGCARRRFPPTPACPYCAHPGSDWVEVPATGTVYSFIVVHRTFDPAFAGEVPYPIATVDLDAGARIVARLAGTPAIGTRVTGMFVDHDGWVELRFRTEDR
ncbi:Zn-ribbon domain-containing OB-fold protein [Prauserella flavalba]|nr:OB-fold domain-containing protein [Prauserella flavalba]